MAHLHRPNSTAPDLSIIGTLVAIVATGIIGLFSADFGAIAIQFIIVSSVFVYCCSYLKPFWESPAVIFGIFMMINGVIGYLFSRSLDNFGGTAAVDTMLPDAIRLQTANLFFVSTLIVVVTATILRSVGDRNHLELAIQIEFPSMGQKFGITYASIVLVSAVYLNGWPWLVSRNSRFAEDTGSLASLVSMMALAALVMLGISVAGSSRIGILLAWILVLLYGFYYFSLASRTLTLLPFMILVGSLIGGSRNKLKLRIGLASFSALLLSPIPLFLRDQSRHGLVPYFQSLEGFKFSIDDWLEAANNVIHGFGIVGTTAFLEPKIPVSSLQISLSPLSGQASGWYEISSELRLGFFTPYGALGEVFNQGWLFVFFFLIVLGVVFGFIQRSGRLLKDSGMLGILRFIPLGLTYLLIIQLTQYNLRSEMRLVYYAVAFQMILLVILKLRSKTTETLRIDFRLIGRKDLMKENDSL